MEVPDTHGTFFDFQMTSSGPRFQISERFSNGTHVNQVLKQHKGWPRTDGRTHGQTGQPKKSFQLANCQIEKAPEGAIRGENFQGGFLIRHFWSIAGFLPAADGNFVASV